MAVTPHQNGDGMGMIYHWFTTLIVILWDYYSIALCNGLMHFIVI